MFAFNVSSQKTVLSEVLRYSRTTAATVDDIMSELHKASRQRGVSYEPEVVHNPYVPQITRPRAEVENETRKYLRHDEVGLR